MSGGEKDDRVSTPDVPELKKALVDAGFESYRTNEEEIQLAERIRFHIMDSGVRVRAATGLTVEFTARSQRSDFPNSDPDELFDRVRAVVGGPAHARGFHEKGFATVNVTDPVDDARILDVWHEVTYLKSSEGLADFIEEVRWALSVDKYVGA